MENATARHPIDLLADDFVARYRRGERPSVSEYTQRYPDLGDQLGEVLRALVWMEELGPAKERSGGRVLGRVTADGQELRQLGDYRILREVGRGGMGVVYEAEQESLGRHVALKVLPYQSLMDPRQLIRFQQEARAAARLHHSNIVPVFGVGEENGIHFYAMQFIRGHGLDEVLRELRRLHVDVTPASGVASAPRGDAPRVSMDASASSTVTLLGQTHVSGGSESSQPYFQSVARVGMQVAEALAYAHSQGVLHRDIKPSNLLLDSQGLVWVTDFGLAKTDANQMLTHTGDIVGTLRYMAPERFNGWSDPRSDVYSLGLTLYELATLRPAFTEEDRAQLIRHISSQDPPRPRSLDCRVPRDLETIILKATIKEPEERYASASEMAEDLRRFLADKPIQARWFSSRERLWRWCRRNPTTAGLTALVAVLLVGISVVSSVAALWLSQERNATVQELDRRVQAEQESQRRLYEVQLARARAGRSSGRIGQRFDSLNALAEAAKIAHDLNLDETHLLELRNEAIACLTLPDLKLMRDWAASSAGYEGHMVYDAKLERYGRSDQEGNISIRGTADNQEQVHLLGHGWAVESMAFSPDGKFLAARYTTNPRDSKTNFVVWDIARRETAFQLPFAIMNPAVDFSPDSQELAVVQNNGTLFICQTPTGKERERSKRVTLGITPQALAYHPGGTKSAIASLRNREVQIRELETGDLLHKLSHPAGVWRVAWQAGGSLLAAACSDRNVYVWNSDTGKQHATLQGHQATVSGVAFTRRGDLILSSGWDGTARLWNTWAGRQCSAFPAVRLTSAVTTAGSWCATG